MKKVAFFMQKMTSGGVEIALLHLLNRIKDNNISVDLYLMKKDGLNLSKIPSYVNIKEIPMKKLERNFLPTGGWKEAVFYNLNKHQFINVMAIIIKKVLYRKQTFAELCFNPKNVYCIDEAYDLVVNYHIHSPFLLWYCALMVKANKKVAWIHNDFSSTGYAIDKLKDCVYSYDDYYCVCYQNKNEFIEIFPDLASKCHIAHNIFDKDMIFKSGQFFPEEYKDLEGTIILTVARLTHDKGIKISSK